MAESPFKFCSDCGTSDWIERSVREFVCAACGFRHFITPIPAAVALILDAEERLLPLDQRRPGLAGHGLALSLLWQELVARRGWSPVQLWQALCWGPSAFLALPPEQLVTGSRRWVLFDPQREWQWNGASCPSQAANQPCWNQPVRGRVVASGLTAAQDWMLPDPGAPSR